MGELWTNGLKELVQATRSHAWWKPVYLISQRDTEMDVAYCRPYLVILMKALLEIQFKEHIDYIYFKLKCSVFFILLHLTLILEKWWEGKCHEIKNWDGIGGVVYDWIVLIMKIEWGGWHTAIMHLGWVFVSLSVFVCMLSNHVHTVLSGQAMLEESLPASSEEHWLWGNWQNTSRHRQCRCQVCWGGNCHCGRPEARSLESESWRENEEQLLLESVRLRG